MSDFLNLLGMSSYLHSGDLDRLAPELLVEGLCEITGTQLEGAQQTILTNRVRVLHTDKVQIETVAWPWLIPIGNSRRLGRTSGYQVCPTCWLATSLTSDGSGRSHCSLAAKSIARYWLTVALSAPHLSTVHRKVFLERAEPQSAPVKSSWSGVSRADLISEGLLRRKRQSLFWSTRPQIRTRLQRRDREVKPVIITQYSVT